jgi:hypothetical protein
MGTRSQSVKASLTNVKLLYNRPYYTDTTAVRSLLPLEALPGMISLVAGAFNVSISLCLSNRLDHNLFDDQPNCL